MGAPHLERYKSVRDRYTCPNCGKMHCFTRYVWDDGTPVGPGVGICDHKTQCGYHLPPREYFKQHPEMRPGQEDWREAPNWLKKKSETPTSYQAPAPQPPRPLCVIPPDIVTRSVSFRRKSDFIRFLDTILDPVIVEGLIDDYRLGVTKSGAVIFFQIDAEGRCRTGNMMMYDPETSHRIKDEAKPGRINWAHAVMKKVGMLPEEWELTQCLFGEHLLPMYPDKPVALVESEKTAVICAGLLPKFLWLATGGKQQINQEKFAVLGKRKITAFPDVDGFAEWQTKLSAIPGLNVTIADVLQKEATPQDFKDHIDIADWLLRDRLRPKGADGRRHSRTFLEIQKYISPEVADEVEALIDDLGLEFFGKVEMVDVEEEAPDVGKGEDSAGGRENS